MEDLPGSLIAAVGGDHIDAAVAMERTLQAGEARASPVETLLEDRQLIVLGVLRIGVVDVHPVDGEDRTRSLVAGGQVTGLPGDRHHLQPPSSGKHPGLARNEPIEPGAGPIGDERHVPGVLGLVHDPRLRIDRHRFVHEAAHGRERHRVDGAGRIRGHLEDVAMALAEPVPLPLRGFLARQPASPRGGSPGAVHARARK